MNPGSRLQPALLAGVFIGVLSALPLVNMGNCCCCLWVVAGGALAAYLRQQSTPFSVPASEGALVGLMAGFFGGIAAVVLSIPMRMITGPIEQQMIDGVLARNPDIPVELRNILEQANAQSAFRAVQAVITLVVYTIFGMLGGLLGVAMFSKSAPPPPPPGTIDVLPPE
jgi:hypothetical protein